MRLFLFVRLIVTGAVVLLTHAAAVGLAADSEVRTLDFPVNRSLGSIYLREDTGDEVRLRDDKWVRFAEAQGSLRIPARHLVRLDLNRAAVADLSPLDQIAADAIHSLNLRYLTADDSICRHVARLTGLRCLSLQGNPITDAGCRQFETLTALRELELSDAKITDEGVAWLTNCKSLQHVAFYRTPIGNRTCERLSTLDQLSSVDVRHSKMTDDGLQNLARLTGLTGLGIGGTAITDRGMASLQPLTELTWLDMSGMLITDAGLQPVAALTRLKNLSLRQNNITDAGLVHLRPLAALEYLDVWGRISDGGLAHLAEIRSLKDLFLGPASYTAQGVSKLATLPNLERLAIGGDHVDDAALAALAPAPKLTKLLVQNCPAGDRGLAALCAAGRLEELSVFRTAVTLPGLDALKQCSRLSRLELALADDNKPLQPKLGFLAGVESLTSLRLPKAAFPAAELTHLQSLTKLEILNIPGPVDDAGLRELCRLTSVKRLSIPNAKATDDGLACLANLPNLQSLQIGGELTNAAVPHLAKLKSLEYFYTGAKGITVEGAKKLVQELPRLSSFSLPAMPDFLGEQRPPSMVGQPAPDFVVTTFDGRRMQLADFRGKVVLVHFWATWCGPCLKALPRLGEVHEELASQHKDYTLLSLSLDQEEAAPRDYFKERRFLWPHARIDTASQTILLDYHARGVPNYFVIGRDGVIASQSHDVESVPAAVVSALKDSK